MGKEAAVLTDDVNSPETCARELHALYTRHIEEVVSFARGKVGAGPPDPEDIAHQAFANYAALEDPKAVRNPIGFVMRTASNLIADHFRRSETKTTFAVDNMILADLIEAVEEIGPETVVLGRERLERVMAALQELPRRQRRFLLLNRIDGVSYTEIARRNGVSSSTAHREVEAAAAFCQRALAELMSDDGS